MSKPESNDMNAGLRKAVSSSVPDGSGSGNVKAYPRAKLLVLLTVALSLCYGVPLYQLTWFAARSQLYSYILLVPFVTLYLAWIQRKKVEFPLKPARHLALALVGLGLFTLVIWWTASASGWELSLQSRLTLLISSYVLCLWGLCAEGIGLQGLRALAFPLAFLIFMVPLPKPWQGGLEAFLQHASAESAYLLLKLAGMPVLRSGTLFQMPNFSLEVAPECSGIHSSLVLFITSLVAGHFFLRNWWSRTLLALSVVVLGILRNAVRIFTLAELCVHVDPRIIDSPLHHKGGPIFFAASLVPFFALLWFLHFIERRRQSSMKPDTRN